MIITNTIDVIAHRGDMAQSMVISTDSQGQAATVAYVGGPVIMISTGVCKERLLQMQYGL